MNSEWSDAQPIYRQLRDLVIARLLDGGLAEGEALPSVRAVAAEVRVNPLTVLKAYQLLVDEGLVEARRGLGMFVRSGAQAAVRAQEREKFLAQQWPAVLLTVRRLGLSIEELLAARAAEPNEPPDEQES